MNHDALCNVIIEHIQAEKPGAIDRDTRLLDENIIDSFSMLGIIILLEELLDIEVQPEDLSSEYFETIAITAEWALAQAKA
jgi:acyl carrier protein